MLRTSQCTNINDRVIQPGPEQGDAAETERMLQVGPHVCVSAWNKLLADSRWTFGSVGWVRCLKVEGTRTGLDVH